jgi:hypothetical protein
MRPWILTILLASLIRCDDCVQAAAVVEKNMDRGMKYQGDGRGDLSAMVEIVYDYGVACHDGAAMMCSLCGL